MTGQMEFGGGELGFSLQLVTAPPVVDARCPGRTVVDGACTVCHAPAGADGQLGRHRVPAVHQGNLL